MISGREVETQLLAGANGPAEALGDMHSFQLTAKKTQSSAARMKQNAAWRVIKGGCRRRSGIAMTDETSGWMILPFTGDGK
jgi:hypothetical protein